MKSRHHIDEDYIEYDRHDREEREDASAPSTKNSEHEKKRRNAHDPTREGPPLDDAGPIPGVGIAFVSEEFHNTDDKERRDRAQIHGTKNAMPFCLRRSVAL